MSDPRPTAPADDDARTGPRRETLQMAVIGAGVLLLLLAVLYLALRGDDGDEIVFDDPTEEPATPTPTPDVTEVPTDDAEAAEATPTPDVTELPTDDPAPTEVAEDADEQPVAPGRGIETEPGEPAVETDGEGDAVSEPFDHAGGLVIVSYALGGPGADGEDDGLGALTVRAVPADETDEGEGEAEEVTLVDGATARTGSLAGALPRGRYQLEVEAEGEWRVVLDRPRFTAGRALPQTIEGADDVVSDPIELTGADVRLDLRSQDGASFEVRVLDAGTGEEVDALSSEDGEVTLSVDQGRYLLEIRAEGRWRVIVT